MHLWEGRGYRDDRVFILDLTPARKNGRSVWAVVTRRNCEGFPTFRVDAFETKTEAIKYIQTIEPASPQVRKGGNSPDPAPAYHAYCQKLKDAELPSAIEIYELNKNIEREIIIEDVSQADLA